MEGKCLIVTKLEKEHKMHAIPEELSTRYPEFRKPKEKIVTEAHRLFNYDVKKHKITNMVLSSGVKATGQDIQNMRYVL